MEEREKETEPPSCLRYPALLIGQDSRGNWVVQDQSGARGGLFVDRAEALKFARSENGNRDHAVVMVSGTLELNMSSGPATALQSRLADNASRARRVA